MELFRQLDNGPTNKRTNRLTELFLKSLSQLKKSNAQLSPARAGHINPNWVMLIKIVAFFGAFMQFCKFLVILLFKTGLFGSPFKYFARVFTQK